MKSALPPERRIKNSRAILLTHRCNLNDCELIHASGRFALRVTTERLRNGFLMTHGFGFGLATTETSTDNFRLEEPLFTGLD